MNENLSAPPDQSARIAELEAENFALAAGQCAEVVGDEGGTPRCKRIAELEAALKVAGEALEMGVAWKEGGLQKARAALQQIREAQR